jgi:hypothetical protein
MNIALLLQQQILAAIGRFMRPPAARQQQTFGPQYLPRVPNQDAIHSVADGALCTRANSTKGSKSLVKPLRVVRLLEAGQASASVGRMVISGRMADVCAELDRLAATEAVLG